MGEESDEDESDEYVIEDVVIVSRVEVEKGCTLGSDEDNDDKDGAGACFC
jgi:hypothetical protein